MSYSSAICFSGKEKKRTLSVHHDSQGLVSMVLCVKPGLLFISSDWTHEKSILLSNRLVNSLYLIFTDAEGQWSSC